MVRDGFEVTAAFHQISRRLCGLFSRNSGESLRAESFFASDWDECANGRDMASPRSLVPQDPVGTPQSRRSDGRFAGNGLSVGAGLAMNRNLGLTRTYFA